MEQEPEGTIAENATACRSALMLRHDRKTTHIDGFEPSIAPGTGTPSHGGFLYYEVLEILQLLVKKGEIIGVDLVEVAPNYDPSDITSMLAAQLLMNLMGFIFETRR